MTTSMQKFSSKGKKSNVIFCMREDVEYTQNIARPETDLNQRERGPLQIS